MGPRAETVHARAGEARLWIGPSGWSYPDWNGVVYPARTGRGFKPLRYLSQFVNAVEVNTSFYQIPAARMTAAWPEMTPAEFRFAFKLTRTFTHERADLPAAADFEAFRAALRPVREAGKLGPVLMQFPWSFRFNAANAVWLERVSGELAEFQRVVEVRHSSWICDDGLAAIAKAGVFCNIDQPRLRDCIGPTARSGAGLAYARFHGRNAASWFAENVPPFERYNYLYNDAELREWVTRFNELMRDAQDVYLFANNHYRGQGVVNALELRGLLEGGRIDVPEPLVSAYPRLAAIAAPPRDAGLFG